jgi:hypothetical protein
MHREFGVAGVPSRRLGGAKEQGNLKERGSIEEEWRKVGRGALGCSVLICCCAEPKTLWQRLARVVESYLGLDWDGERGRVMASVGLDVCFWD